MANKITEKQKDYIRDLAFEIADNPIYIEEFIEDIVQCNFQKDHLDDLSSNEASKIIDDFKKNYNK